MATTTEVFRDLGGRRDVHVEIKADRDQRPEHHARQRPDEEIEHVAVARPADDPTRRVGRGCDESTNPDHARHRRWRGGRTRIDDPEILRERHGRQQRPDQAAAQERLIGIVAACSRWLSALAPAGRSIARRVTQREKEKQHSGCNDQEAWLHCEVDPGKPRQRHHREFQGENAGAQDRKDHHPVDQKIAHIDGDDRPGVSRQEA